MPSGLTVPTLGGCLSRKVICRHLASGNARVLMSLPSRRPNYLEADCFPVRKDLTSCKLRDFPSQVIYINFCLLTLVYRVWRGGRGEGEGVVGHP